MEEKLELSDDDCRRYYQLVQKNVSPEKTEYIHKPSFVIHEGSNQDEEDLGLAFQDSPQTSNNILPKENIILTKKVFSLIVAKSFYLNYFHI